MQVLIIAIKVNHYQPVKQKPDSYHAFYLYDLSYLMYFIVSVITD